MKTRILLTGTNGFIGQYVLDEVVRTFQSSDFEVMSLVRAQPVKFYQDVSFIQGDLTTNLPEPLKSFDPHVVVHLASLLKSGSLEEYRKVNVLGTQNLLDHLGPSLELFIYNSSMSVYGQGPFSEPVKENAKKSPQTDLAKTRLEAEQWIEKYCQRRGISAFLLRPRFILGKNDKSTLPSLRKLSLRPLKIGDEKQKFSCIHVKDYAKIICHLIRDERGIERCEALNICYEKSIELSYLLRLLNPKRVTAWLVPLPISFIIWLLSLFGRSNLLTKLELIGQDQMLSSEKLKTYLPENFLNNEGTIKIKEAIEDYQEFKK